MDVFKISVPNGIEVGTFDNTTLHSKQNKRFLATATALNTNETSKYTYELLLTSTDRLLLSKSISLHCLQLALEHTFLLSQQMAKQAQTLRRYAIQYETIRDFFSNKSFPYGAKWPEGLKWNFFFGPESLYWSTFIILL